MTVALAERAGVIDMPLVLDPVEKAVLEFLPRGGTKTIRALTHGLCLVEEEAQLALNSLVAMGLAGQVRPSTYSLTDLGLRRREAPIRVSSA